MITSTRWQHVYSVSKPKWSCIVLSSSHICVDTRVVVKHIHRACMHLCGIACMHASCVEYMQDIRTYIHKYIHIHMYMHTHVCMHACLCVHNIYIYIYIYIYILHAYANTNKSHEVCMLEKQQVISHMCMCAITVSYVDFLRTHIQITAGTLKTPKRTIELNPAKF